MSKLKKFGKSHYEWLFYAESYLGLAKIGCYELIQQNYRNKKSTMDDLLYGLQGVTSKLLPISILFNIKHSIELFIKATGISLDKQYWKNHDIDFLLKDFEKRIRGFPNLKTDPKLIERIEKVKPVIKRYFRCEFFKKITGVKDFQNELFRYPESDDPQLTKLTDYYKSPNVFEEVGGLGIGDLEIILEDIEDIHKMFSLVRGRLGLIKAGLK